MRNILEDNANSVQVDSISLSELKHSSYNWDFEWSYILEDKGEEYLTYGLYLNQNLEGIMTVLKDMQGSLVIHKLEVSASNRFTSRNREFKGIGSYLVAYACWLATNEYNEESKGLVSLYSKKSSEAFYISLGAEKMPHIDDLYFLFTEDVVNRLAEKVII